MNKPFLRLVYLLLIPCLLADPALAAVYQLQSAKPFHVDLQAQSDLFAREALVASVINFIATFSPKGKHQEVLDYKEATSAQTANQLAAERRHLNESLTANRLKQDDLERNIETLERQLEEARDAEQPNARHLSSLGHRIDTLRDQASQLRSSANALQEQRDLNGRQINDLAEHRPEAAGAFAMAMDGQHSGRQMNVGRAVVDVEKRVDVIKPQDAAIPYNLIVPTRKEDEVIASYRLAKDTLGGLTPPMSLLRDVSFVINGETRHFPIVILIQKSIPLHEVLSRSLDAGTAQGILDQIYDLERQMYVRGVHNQNHKIQRNPHRTAYGFDANSRVVLQDIAYLSQDPKEFYRGNRFGDYYSQLHPNNLNELRSLSNAVADYHEKNEIDDKQFAALWGAQQGMAQPVSDILPLNNDGFAETGLFLGVRDLSPESSGAFTGQTSKTLALDTGASYALIGTPRQGADSLSGETPLTVARKVERAIKGEGGKLSPIIVINIDQVLWSSGEKQWQKKVVDELTIRLLPFAAHPDALRNLAIAPQVVDKNGAPVTLINLQMKNLHKYTRRAVTQVLENTVRSNVRSGHDDALLLKYSTNAKILRAGKMPTAAALEVQSGMFVDSLRYVDGILVDPSYHPDDVVELLKDIAKVYAVEPSAVSPSPRGPPMMVVNLTQTYGERAEETVSQIKTAMAEDSRLRKLTTVVIPTNLDLRRTGQIINDNNLYTPGVQAEPTNIHFALQDLEDYSPDYLAAVKRDGYTYVLIGHSEVRRFFGTSDELVAEQARAILKAGLIPVIAIGERNRTVGDWRKGLHDQTMTVLKHISLEDLPNVRLAYEPIDFIGSGTNMATDQMVEANEIIARAVIQHVHEQGGPSLEESDPLPVGILYGGSVKPSSVYGQSGGWERRTMLQRLRRMSHVIGGLVGTRSLVPGDPDRISDRFAENVLAKGKAVRGDTGGNWKMNVHTLDDATRRVAAFQKNIKKNRWKGEFFFAVPASMGGDLALRFRGQYAPTTLRSLEWTDRQKAINRLINQFWTWWEDNGQSSGLASLKEALKKFHEMYQADKEMSLLGISWYRVYSQAFQSNLFADSKRLVPAMQLLISLRYAPLDLAISQIKDDSTRELVQKTIGGRGAYFHELSKEDVTELYRQLARHFKLHDYAAVILRHVIPPVETLRSPYISGEQETVARYWENVLEVAKDALTHTHYSASGQIAALWDLRDIILNVNLDQAAPGLRERARDALANHGAWPDHAQAVWANFNAIRIELAGQSQEEVVSPIEFQLLTAMHQVKFISFEVGHIQKLYVEAVNHLTADTSDETLDHLFDQAEYLTEAREHEVLKNVSDSLSAENEPARSVKDKRSKRDALLEEVYFARIWGGIRPYLIRKLKLARDEKRKAEQAQTPPAANGRIFHQLAPIQQDAPDAPYEAVLAQPVEFELDVDGAFGGKNNLSLKNTAVQIVRRSLGTLRGQGFNPNMQLETIYGINNAQEFHAFFEHLVANPYQGRIMDDFKAEVQRDYVGAYGMIRVTAVVQGVKLEREILVRGGHYEPTSPNLNTILLTSQDTVDTEFNNLVATHSKRFENTIYLLNPDLDPPFHSLKENVVYENTGLTSSLRPLMQYLDREFGTQKGPGIKQWKVSYTTPGESHNLRKVDMTTARHLVWGERGTLGSGERWESHTHEGAGFVQLNLTLQDDAHIDLERITEVLRAARLQGWPIYFAEGGWTPNSISVQAQDKPLIVDKTISVQGNGRLVTLRCWIPDWAAADHVLNSMVTSHLNSQEAVKAVTLPQAVSPVSISYDIPAGKKTNGALKTIGLYGGDEVVSGQLIRQLRGEDGLILKYIYVEETTENPLDTNVYAAYLRQIMPHSDIEIGPEGDTLIINHSSPIKVVFGKGRVVPDWKKEGVDTVIIADKNTKDSVDTRKKHQDKGAQRIIVATQPRQAIESVVALARTAFAGRTIQEEIIHTNAAVDPYRDRSHDIIVGNDVLPAPFANLLPTVAQEGHIDIQSSQYDVNLTAVNFLLDKAIDREEVIARFKEAASQGPLRLVDKHLSLKPSLLTGQSAVYVDLNSVIVEGRTVTVLLGYDYANVWAAQVLNDIKTEEKEIKTLAPTPERVKAPEAPKKDKLSLVQKPNVVTYIPAPVAKPEKPSLGHYNRVAVDVSALSFDANRRDPLDYAASSLVIDLMGDERLSVQFYGVRTSEDALFLYHAIKKRLPKHIKIYLDGFDEKHPNKYKEDLETQGYTFLHIQGAKIMISKDSILKNPYQLNRDHIDSVLVLSTQRDSAQKAAYEELRIPYYLNGVRFLNPYSDGVSLVKTRLKDAMKARGLEAHSVRVLKTEPGRTSEFHVRTGLTGLAVQTPTRLEGDLSNVIIEFDEEVDRDQIIGLVEEMERGSQGRVEVTEEPVASLDLVDNPVEAMISKPQITGKGRLWSIPVWMGETGIAQHALDQLADDAVNNPVSMKNQRQTATYSILKSIVPLVDKARLKEMKGKKVDLVVSAVGGRTGKNMLLATIGDPNVNLLGVTLNKPTEGKVIATANALNNDTVYGRPGIRFEYGGWDSTSQNFVIWAGSDEAGWMRINVYDGSSLSGLKDKVKEWRKAGLKPVYLHAAGSGYHRFKEKDWFEIQGKMMIYGNPGKGESLLTIPGVSKFTDSVLRALILMEEIFSLGSCTTGALAVSLEIVRHMVDYLSAITYHELTNDQRLNHGPLHDEIERLFPAARTMLLSTSGAGQTIGKVMPELMGRTTAVALREGYGGASIVTVTAKLKADYAGLTTEAAKDLFRDAYERPELAGIFHLHDKPYPLDADEVKGYPHSSVLDLNSVRVEGDYLSWDAWYDNERGFSTRMINLSKRLFSILWADETVASPLANVSVSWRWNLPLRVAGFFSAAVPLHEIGHYIAAYGVWKGLATAFRPANLVGLFVGRARVPATPRVLLSGPKTNLYSGIALSLGALISAVLMPHASVPLYLASAGAVNLTWVALEPVLSFLRGSGDVYKAHQLGARDPMIRYGQFLSQAA